MPTKHTPGHCNVVQDTLEEGIPTADIPQNLLDARWLKTFAGNMRDGSRADCQRLMQIANGLAQITPNFSPVLVAALLKIDSNAAESVEWIRRVTRQALREAGIE